MDTLAINPTLIVDIGVSEGNDSAFYLAKGFDVLGVEADPTIVPVLERRFARELSSGQFTLLPFAADEVAGKTVSFWHHKAEQGRSGSRNVGGPGDAEHKVRTIDWPGLRAVAGVPHYMKIDIEGAEESFLASFARDDLLPRYISCEAQGFGPIARLHALGYDRFRLVNQLIWPGVPIPDPPLEGRLVRPATMHHWSGLFGRELPGTRWFLFEEIREIYETIHRLWQKETLIAGWLDCHACRSNDPMVFADP